MSLDDSEQSIEEENEDLEGLGDLQKEEVFWKDQE